MSLLTGASITQPSCPRLSQPNSGLPDWHLWPIATADRHLASVGFSDSNSALYYHQQPAPAQGILTRKLFIMDAEKCEYIYNSCHICAVFIFEENICTLAFFSDAVIINNNKYNNGNYINFSIYFTKWKPCHISFPTVRSLLHSRSIPTGRSLDLSLSLYTTPYHYSPLQILTPFQIITRIR